jgi:hypothetical protein
MIIIPGFIIALLTFPGIIVHEMAHQFFCRITGTAVLNVCYFRIGNPAGYVVHEAARSPGKSLLISIAPFFFNTIVGALIAAPAAMSQDFNEADPLNFLLLWLGISIAMHSFPSTGDAQSLWGSLRQEPWWLRVLVAPIVALIFVGAIGSFIWLDVLYGVGVAFGVPKLVVQLFA